MWENASLHDRDLTCASDCAGRDWGRLCFTASAGKRGRHRRRAGHRHRPRSRHRGAGVRGPGRCKEGPRSRSISRRIATGYTYVAYNCLFKRCNVKRCSKKGLVTSEHVHKCEGVDVCFVWRVYMGGEVAHVTSCLSESMACLRV